MVPERDHGGLDGSGVAVEKKVDGSRNDARHKDTFLAIFQ